MKLLYLPVFFFATISASGQTECEVDGLPCYEYYRIEMQTGSDQRPQKWKGYQVKLEDVYESSRSFHTWRKNQPKDRFVIVSAIILTGSKQPFTVLEKYEYNWGGVFYFMDFMAITESKYLDLEVQFEK